MSENIVINESEVTKERIIDILKSSFYSANFDDDGDIVIKENGFKVWIRVSEEIKILRIFTVFSFYKESTHEQKQSFVENANKNSIMKFSIVNEDSFFADFNIMFSGGLIAANLVISLRRVLSLIPLIINQSDTENIVN